MQAAGNAASVGRRSHRVGYVLLALGTIAIGLLVHRGGVPLSPALRDILGDLLWAAMIYWWISAVAPGAGRPRRIIAALIACWAVESSQVLDLPALNAMRRTTPGHLVLGSDFDARDLIAYTAGVLGAAVLDIAMRGRLLPRVRSG